MKDKITEMASMIESLQMSMSLLQKSHKNLQDNVIVSTHICLVLCSGRKCGNTQTHGFMYKPNSYHGNIFHRLHMRNCKKS